MSKQQIDPYNEAGQYLLSFGPTYILTTPIDKILGRYIEDMRARGFLNDGPPALVVRLERDALGLPAIQIRETGNPNVLQLLPGESIDAGRCSIAFEVAQQIDFANPNSETGDGPLPRAVNGHSILCRSRDGSELCDCSLSWPATPDPSSPDVAIKTKDCPQCGKVFYPDDAAASLRKFPDRPDMIFCNYGCLSGYDPSKHCPRCDSPDPVKHPAVQFEGEVPICSDPFHERPTNATRICDRCKQPFSGGAQVTPQGVFCSIPCATIEAPTAPEVTLSPALPFRDLDLDPVENCSICKAELHASEGFTLLDNSEVKESRFCHKCAFMMNIAPVMRASE
jgi:hypothetical protein